jgi:hypothetical protein
MGLYPSGYYLFRGADHGLSWPEEPAATARVASPPAASPVDSDRLWKGWLLPASPADTWFVAGSAAYRQMLQSGDVARAMAARRAVYRGLKLGPENDSTRIQLESARGVLFLDALRLKLGDDAFLKLMSDYFTANATKTVTAQSFLDQAGTAFDVPEARRRSGLPDHRHRPPPGDSRDRLRHSARRRRQPLRGRADAKPLPRPVRK